MASPDEAPPAQPRLAALDRGERARLGRLERLVAEAERAGPARLAEDDLVDLPRLVRHASTLLARLEAQRSAVGLEAALRTLVARANALLARDAGSSAGPWRRWPARALRFLVTESPRAIRAEWRLLTVVFAAFYGLAGAAGWFVSRDLELAWTLFDEGAVRSTIEQLRETPAGEPFRGNFTFGIGEAPRTAGIILAHNIGVSVVFFAAALVPPLFAFLLAQNALMVGTYTALAGHWGQAGAISSILWCHGVIELQMIVLAGAAGLVLVRAVVAPGAWDRRERLTRDARLAWRLFAPVAPLLVVSGLIEGYVSPHAPLGIRIGTAIGTGLALCAWVALGGRRAAEDPGAGLEPGGDERRRALLG